MADKRDPEPSGAPVQKVQISDDVFNSLKEAVNSVPAPTQAGNRWDHDDRHRDNRDTYDNRNYDNRPRDDYRDQPRDRYRVYNIYRMVKKSVQNRIFNQKSKKMAKNLAFAQKSKNLDENKKN